MNPIDSIAPYMTNSSNRIRCGDFCTICRKNVSPADICVRDQHRGIKADFMTQFISRQNNLQAKAQNKNLEYFMALSGLQQTIRTTQDNLIEDITIGYNEIENGLKDMSTAVGRMQAQVETKSTETRASTDVMLNKISAAMNEAETSNSTLIGHKSNSKFTKIMEHKLNTKLPNDIMDVIATSYDTEQDVAATTNSLKSGMENCHHYSYRGSNNLPLVFLLLFSLCS